MENLSSEMEMKMNQMYILEPKNISELKSVGGA